MGNHLSQALLVCLAVVSLGLFVRRRRGPGGQFLRFDAEGNASASGLVTQGGDRDGYLLRAEAGQFLSVVVTSPGQNVVFHVRLPGREEETLPGAAPGDRARSWRGMLPRAGLYRILVESRRGNAPYVLRVARRAREREE